MECLLALVSVICTFLWLSMIFESRAYWGESPKVYIFPVFGVVNLGKWSLFHKYGDALKTVGGLETILKTLEVGKIRFIRFISRL